ncbi:MAG: hypothetical protein CME57_06815 [Halieaceae bacterium]|nr:hypothetical protein [Halieaceae bacterium]
MVSAFLLLLSLLILPFSHQGFFEGSCHPGYCEQSDASSITNRRASLLAAQGIHKQKELQKMAELPAFLGIGYSFEPAYCWAKEGFALPMDF